MNPRTRTCFKSALVALATSAILVPAFAQSVPAAAPASASSRDAKGPAAPVGPTIVMPASTAVPGLIPAGPYPGGPSPMAPQTNALPKYLEGIITLDEFQSFMKFQQQVNDDPASKELIAKIIALRQQAQQLQAELSKMRGKALADNPGMKAIADKMQAAMLAHSPMPPMSMMPAPAPTAPAPKP